VAGNIRDWLSWNSGAEVYTSQGIRYWNQELRLSVHGEEGGAEGQYSNSPKSQRIKTEPQSPCELQGMLCRDQNRYFEGFGPKIWLINR
jgi:hypothetical protein